MKRLVLAVTLAAVLMANTNSTLAGDYYRVYSPDYPYAPEPYPAGQPEYPLLRKLIVGGVLVGVGYAVGRLTAPQSQPYYSNYSPQPYYNSPQPNFPRQPMPYGGHHGGHGQSGHGQGGHSGRGRW